MATTVTSMIAHPDSEPKVFILPDLVSNCHYPLRMNPHCYPVSRASNKWLIDELRLVEPRSTQIIGFRVGEFSAACYSNTDAFRLRVYSDYMGWLFAMDDWLEQTDVDQILRMRQCCISAFRDPINFETEKFGRKLCRSYFSRFRETGGPGCTERFIHTMDLYLRAVAKEVDNHAKGCILDLESFIALRRETICVKPSLAFIEYAAQIDLPTEVVSHPNITAMENAVIDYAACSNDIFSYNVEQCRRYNHNIIICIMHEQGLDLQGAMEYAGQLCKDAIQRFEANRADLPSLGKEIDEQVAIYVEGLQDWIVSSLHWSFDTNRYFGNDGHIVKQDRIVKVLPKMPL
ncbi:terpenoid synthase [Rhizopogon vinicolor AM-OR11-026]|uniref:Terpene synthase n=1 Tax=Rhizopogon vinicolor AM-OR11-026 TaxID=1314800 RepID=A0A1B7N214_9AGAM|nr:terpenoid synthase [Rhizopogon vinicolor AM-OR11-026]